MLNKRTVVLLLLLLAATPSLTVIDTALGSSDSPTNQSAPQAVEDSTWTQKAPMPTARYDARVAVVNNKIYCIGGRTGSSEKTLVNVNEMYDPTTDTWTEKAPMPTHRAGFAIAVYDGKIYCIGGISYQLVSGVRYGWVNLGVNEVYDPATDTWENKAPLPTERSGMQSAVVNNSIYIIGGSPNATFNEAYNPETDTWSTKAPIQYYEESNQSITRFKIAPSYSTGGDSAVVGLDEKIFWIGKMRAPNSTGDLMFMLIYNPIRDSWDAGTPPTGYMTAQNAVATSGVWAPKGIYVIGPGRAMYDPVADNWSSDTKIPGYNGAGFAVVDDKIYSLGGYYTALRVVGPGFAVPVGQVVTDATFEYIPLGYGTIPPLVSASSPINGASGNVTFNVTVNRHIDQITYSLDGQDNVTVSGNFTLGSLPEGSHNVTVYATDNFGNIGKSETISFTVQGPPPGTLAIVAGIAGAVAAAGLLVYRNKHKKPGATSGAS